MDIRVLLLTIFVLALVLATVAGFIAARLLMHAAASGPTHGGGSNDH